MDDQTYASWIIALLLVAPPIAGFSLGGFSGGISMIFFSLIVLPVAMYFLGVGLFYKHEDIYG